MVMKKESSLKVWISVLAILTLVSSIVINHYNHSLNENLSEYICGYISEIIVQQKNNLELDIKSDMSSLNNIAGLIGRERVEKEEIVELMKEVKVNTNFDNLYIVDLYGKGFSQDNVEIDVLYRDYFQSALKGQTTVGTPVISQVTGILVTPMAAPVYDIDDRLVGVMVGSYSIQKLRTLMLPTFGGKGVSRIFTGDGDIVASSESYEIDTQNQVNVFEKLENVEFAGLGNLDLLHYNMEHMEPGHISYYIDGVLRYAHYIPLGINDWYMYLAVDYDHVASIAETIKVDSIITGVSMLFIVTVIFIYLLYRFNKTNKKYTKTLYETAYFDSVTELPNLEMFKKEIQTILENEPQQQFACVVFDMKNFKFINDTYGFNVGNSVLRIVAKIGKDLKEDDGRTCFSRLYSDTFAMFTPYYSHQISQDVCDGFVSKLRKKINFIDGYQIDLHLGRYIVEENQLADVIIEKANLAHSKAQSMRPNMFVDYSDEDYHLMKNEVMFRNNIETAFMNKEFQAFYQPKYNLETNEIVGAEALARWNRNGVYFPPDRFIPSLEKNGMIIALDLYIFEEACLYLKKIQDEGKPLYPISVNFSRYHLEAPHFSQTLKEIIDRHNISSQYLLIEFTETVTMSEEVRIIEIINELHQYGFIVSMDDFGSGYSSLGSLDTIMVDEIKLDKSFIDNITINERAKHIVGSIISLANQLKIAIIAEGVETDEQVSILKDLNCLFVQGYYFSRPLEEEEFYKLCYEKKGE